MNNIDIKRLDPAMLLVLSSLMRTGQATATARELGLTQSSISHSLSKLRNIFLDELFVRRPQGLEPTGKAKELQPKIEKILELLQDAISSAPFDPGRATGLLRIACSDYPSTLLAAPILARWEKEAPGATLNFLPLVGQSAIAALLDDDVDFAIGPFADDARLDSRFLWQDEYLIVARRGHPITRKACTLRDYCAARHVRVSPGGASEGIIDSVLAARGLSRRIVATVPYFLTALATVARSDAIATMPALLARAHGQELGLKLLQCPMTIRRLRINLVTKRRSNQTALAQWLGDLIFDVTSQSMKQTLSDA